MEKEIYKDIPNFEGYYQASNFGNIKRLAIGLVKKERVMCPMDNGRGYLSVPLCKQGTKKRYYVHRLVAAAFLSNYENKEEVNHIDGNRNNNTLSNLEWVTRSENHFHRYKVLKQKGVNYGKKGKDIWASKVVIMMDLQGNEIRRFHGNLEAMRETGIHESNIRSVIYGKSKTAGGYKWKYA